jgi:hypothetical protein
MVCLMSGIRFSEKEIANKSNESEETSPERTYPCVPIEKTFLKIATIYDIGAEI